MKFATAALATLIVGGGFALPAAPALAQNQRIIEVYGNDPCPTSNGEEIVVCNRRPDRDRYRIPERLRTTQEGGIGRNSGVALAESTESASRASMAIDSCSPVGSGGQAGCFRDAARKARAERRQASREAPVVDARVSIDD